MKPPYRQKSNTVRIAWVKMAQADGTKVVALTREEPQKYPRERKPSLYMEGGTDSAEVSRDKNSEDDPSDNRENERMNTTRQYILQIYDRYDQDGFFNIPVIHNDGFIPNQMIGFNYAMTASDFETGIHFFVDDYQFERLWNSPEQYIDLLRKFQCVLSHDITWLNHELYESILVKDGLTVQEAHEKIELIYNYAKETDEYYASRDKKHRRRRGKH